MFTTIDEKRIDKALAKEPTSRDFARVLAKSESLERLSMEDVAILLNNPGRHTDELLFSRAREIKKSIYGKRIVLFAPLYISNLCANDCLYCAFRTSNRHLARTRLTMEEVRRETQALLDSGQRRALVVSGESCTEREFEHIIESINTIYSVDDGKGGIRRLNVNIAPVTNEQFVRLKEAQIGTYQLFQETYNRETYHKVHPRGPKADYEYRLGTIDRALEAGLDDLGIGVLFGLHDYRREVLSLLSHVEHLEATHGLGPHTISVPRLEPAQGCDLASSPPWPVSDGDFLRIIAILRMAVPYTGIILSTRESPEIRRRAFALGVSQVSAGSRTNPGGYSSTDALEQFSLGDHRSLDEVVRDILEQGYIPSFCTSCYRLGRTGLDFMDLAKPGDIGKKCAPNGILTLKEYLSDYASEETRALGESVIATMHSEAPDPLLDRLLLRVENGERDIFV
ncbi:[FeFe] hydrogenase H-cluster radical SAM maturase HydG [Myxococcota bacterium]|nr:[FeFe] hydrogenase H-cluster radical SAM maturase HydG [Myxococcota bacterium]